MSCPKGQIQIGVDPNTFEPICIDEANYTNLQKSNGQQPTGATPNGTVWGQVIGTLPGLLSGVADIVGASKGNQRPDSTIVVQQPVPQPIPEKKSSPWGWIITLIILVGITFSWIIWRKKRSA